MYLELLKQFSGQRGTSFKAAFHLYYVLRLQDLHAAPGFTKARYPARKDLGAHLGRSREALQSSALHFNSQARRDRESVIDFVAALGRLSDHCGYNKEQQKINNNNS